MNASPVLGGRTASLTVVSAAEDPDVEEPLAAVEDDDELQAAAATTATVAAATATPLDRSRRFPLILFIVWVWRIKLLLLHNAVIGAVIINEREELIARHRCRGRREFTRDRT
jgi:hypothetical protein